MDTTKETITTLEQLLKWFYGVDSINEIDREEVLFHFNILHKNEQDVYECIEMTEEQLDHFLNINSLETEIIIDSNDIGNCIDNYFLFNGVEYVTETSHFPLEPIE